jgi:hypothetical protein
LEPTDSDHLFNMAVSCYKNEACGSICCIGGAIAMVMGMTAEESRAYVGGWSSVGTASKAFQDLFYPRITLTASEKTLCTRSSRTIWQAITLAQAAEAIRNFIFKGGNPDWNTILGRPNK